MSETINIITIGDVVGEPGRRAVQKLLPVLRQQYRCDFCVVNGENAAGGAGITPKIFSELREAGADIITSGDHIWDNIEILSIMGIE